MKGKKVLVVEDENIVAMEIRDRLQDMGYTVTAVVSAGEDSLKKIAETRPDLVLMDIMLKGKLDGVQAAEKIRIQYDIPVIYLSAFADNATLQRAKITEPYGYIMKPFVEKELHTTIEMALYKHKMEKKIRENEQWLATTLNSINDAVIATNEVGQIKFMNPVAEQLTGWKQAEALGKNLKDVFHIIDAKSRAPFEDPFDKVLNQAQFVNMTQSILLIARDGTERIISDSGAPIRDKNNKTLGLVIVFRDITERQKLEADLLKAQKLESIGLLAGGIAHDFNNILTAILGNISLARADLDPNSEIYEILNEAEKASLQAKNLTFQLLTFAKGGTPLKAEASITELIKTTAEFALRGSNVNCTYSFPDDLWVVEVDRGQISQAIQNLIVNADQAMPEGGTIHVSTENISLHPDDGLPLQPGRYVKISIIDTGVGIPEDLLQKIFDPYFTTKKKEAGLGLAITYSIIKKHGGHITVESELDRGTTVHIYLPCSSEQEAPNNIKVSLEESPPKGKILVMDDEDLIRKIAKRILNRIGYEVEITANGTEAIEFYQQAYQAHHPFDAVILDLTVPGDLGGKETVKKLLQIDPQVKAIVSSGYSNDPIMAEYKKYGFRGVVMKPYKFEELNQALSQIL